MFKQLTVSHKIFLGIGSMILLVIIVTLMAYQLLANHHSFTSEILNESISQLQNDRMNRHEVIKSLETYKTESMKQLTHAKVNLIMISLMAIILGLGLSFLISKSIMATYEISLK